MHIPEFPPKSSEWRPSPPPFPPLPSWVFNPLTPDEVRALEEEFGKWASARTLAMLSPAETYETVRAFAKSMYESMKSQALAGLPPIPPTPPTVRRERKPREKVAKEVEELAEIMKPKVLTPELEESLVGAATDFAEIRYRHRRPRIEEQQEFARTVRVWAEEQGVTISEEKAKEIVDKVLAAVTPART